MATLDEDTLKNLMTARVLGKVPECARLENKYMSPEGLYCWKGIVTQQYGKNCTLASVCDPTSFTGARSRFCATFQRYSGKKRELCEIGKYVADPGDPSPTNNRGGIMTNVNSKECGQLAGWLGCILNGTKQSLTDFKRDKKRAVGAMVSLVAATVFLVLAVGYYRKHIRGRKI